MLRNYRFQFFVDYSHLSCDLFLPCFRFSIFTFIKFSIFSRLIYFNLSWNIFNPGWSFSYNCIFFNSVYRVETLTRDEKLNSESEVDSELFQTTKMESFTKSFESFKLYTTTFKSSVLNVWRGSGCTSGHRYIITSMVNTEGLKHLCFTHMSQFYPFLLAKQPSHYIICCQQICIDKDNLIILVSWICLSNVWDLEIFWCLFDWFILLLRNLRGKNWWNVFFVGT